MERAKDCLDRIETRYLQPCYTGIGYEMGLRFKNDPALRADLISRIDASYREAVESGMIEGMLER